jgi:Amt family ammonium transporter
LGPRLSKDKTAKPHSMALIVFGTIFIWFGSFGYNSGSAYAANLQAIFSWQVCIKLNSVIKSK